MSEKHYPPLLIPALRAFMGSWAYYIGFMQMKDIADRVSIAQDIHITQRLQEFLQRQLSSRSMEIANYLLYQEQRFFNSLVIGTYGGQPQWIELGVKSKDAEQEEWLQDIEGKVGFLELSGDEILFAIDGQHRIAGIREAIKQSKSLESEEVSVIFVAGVTQSQRDKDLQGFERTRRLFTTLNRYAKPVSKKDIIALDEDDAVAIITRRLIEEHPLFKDKVSSRGTNSVQRNDKISLTTITNLYDVLSIYLDRDIDGFPFKKRVRPDDQVLESLYNKSATLFDKLAETFLSLKEFYDSQPQQRIAGKYRHLEGGLILFRPIGLKMIITVVVDLNRQGFSLEESLLRLGNVELELGKEPWLGLIWNASSKRMMTASENQKAARLLLLYSVGGSLETAGSDVEKLRTELAGLMNRRIEQVELPKYV